MKLVYPHDVPRLGVVRTFRHSRLAPIVTFLVVAGGTGWWIAATVLNEDAEWVRWLPAALGFLMCFVILIYVRKAMKATNWLMKVTEDGLFVKFRSYLNDGLPEDGPTIVHIPYAEVERVQPGRRKLTLPDRDGRITSSLLRFIDIHLRHDATGELATALKVERGMRPVRNGAAKHHDYPLRVYAPNQLRLEWKVRPGLQTALETLQRFVAVEFNESKSDLDWAKLDPPAKEAMIIELAELGERMRARHLAEELHGLDKAEAKAYVDELTGRTDR